MNGIIRYKLLVRNQIHNKDSYCAVVRLFKVGFRRKSGRINYVVERSVPLGQREAIRHQRVAAEAEVHNLNWEAVNCLSYS